MTDSGLKIPKWDGKRSSYLRFKQKMKSYATLKGFASALVYDPKAAIPTTWVDPDTLADTDPIKKALKHNNTAMAVYTQAFDTDRLLAILENSNDPANGYHDGRAWMVAKKLDDKFALKDKMETHDLRLAMCGLTIGCGTTIGSHIEGQTTVNSGMAGSA